MQRQAIIGVGIAGHPFSAAGNTWAFLQWVLGFKSLGWKVWIVESIESKDFKNAHRASCTAEHSHNVAYWNEIIAEFGLSECATLLMDGNSPDLADLIQFSNQATVFLNLSGHFKPIEMFSHVPHRVYVDLDPAFTQIWATQYQCDMNFEGHNFFFSVGALLEANTPHLPSTGHHWMATFPPVDLDFWKPQSDNQASRFTTITHWYGYADIEWDNTLYGSKAQEFEKIKSLPSLTSSPLCIATDLPQESDEYQSFSQAGWDFTSSASVCENRKTYHQFIANSRGELSVAKNGYVHSKTGWMSDRSVCYLAMGKPVILQDTGWTNLLPSGEGLLAFHDLDSASHALEQVNCDYSHHCQTARRLAEEFFDAKKVVTSLLKKIQHP